MTGRPASATFPESFVREYLASLDQAAFGDARSALSKIFLG